MIVGEGLVQLQQRSLIWSHQGRYFLLSLTRGYTLVELAMNPTVEQDMRDRWVDTYLSISEEFGTKDWKEWYPPDADLEVEWENLTAVLEWCIATHQYEAVRSLWQHVKDYAQVRGYWDDRLVWSQWLLQAAEADNDWATVVEVMTDRAWTLTLMGQPQCLAEAERLLQEAWTLRTHQSPLQHLEIANHLAVFSIRQNQFKQAQHWLTEEKTLLEQIELLPQQAERQ